MKTNDADSTSYPWLRNYPPFAGWSMELPQKPVFELLREAVDKYPGNTCMEFLGKRWTYRETGELAARVAKGFQDLGVEKGARVGLLLPNTPYYVAAFFGAQLAGATIVNMNPLYAERELEQMVADAGIDVLVTMDLTAMYPKAEALLGKTSIRKLIVCSMSEALPLGTSILFN
ncbi:MAG: AMP-binding protein, partial [Rhodospirillaceae bacterium]